MKKFIAALLALTFLCVLPALADGVVICVNCRIDGHTSWTITDDSPLTAEAFVPEGSHFDHWEINGVRTSETGPYCTFTPSGNTVVNAICIEGAEEPVDDTDGTDDPVIFADLTETPTPAPTLAPPVSMADDDDGRVIIRAVGAKIQKLDEYGNAVGEELDELDLTGGPVPFKVRAIIPGRRSVDSWTLNGVSYRFSVGVRTLRFWNVTESMTIEAVLDKAESTTKYTQSQIDALRTGDTLLLTCEHARMTHIRGKMTAGGGYFTEFNFTNDYTNRASNATVAGGRITAKVISNLPAGKRVAFWMFDDMKVGFDNPVEFFFVYDQVKGINYEPIYATDVYLGDWDATWSSNNTATGLFGDW